MVNIITREIGDTAKGSPLTNAEIDGNFINLKNSIEDVGKGLGDLAFQDAKNLQAINLMKDSGRFGEYADPLSLGVSNTFVHSDFLEPFNGATVVSGGKFTHNNATFGGSGGALTQTVQDLIAAMGRTGDDARYGVEFHVARYTAGTGTSTGMTAGGVTRYLLTQNLSKPLYQSNNWATFVGWVRVVSGTIHFNAECKINGVFTGHGAVLNSTAGWVHVMAYQQQNRGYNYGFPGIQATAGAVVEIACAGIFNAFVDVGIHKAPLATIKHVVTIPEVPNLTTKLNEKAPLKDPTFTGNPKAPTPAVDDNGTSIATTAFVQTALNAKEPSITAGTTAQYRRGDKTWQDFATAVRASVLTGLSTATATAIAAADSVLIALGKLQGQIDSLNTNKLDSTANAVSATKLATARNINGVAFDGTADITIADSTKEPAFAAGTTAQYRRGDKTWQDFATAVRASVLTGLSTATATAVLATDSVLSALGKLQGQINTLDTSKLDATANAVSASKLQTARSITLAGGVSGSTTFDGSSNVSITATVANDSHTHDTRYPVLSAERVLSNIAAGSWVTIAQVPSQGGRAYGEFIVYDTDSGKHNVVKIIASHSYGQSVVACVGGNRFGTRTIAHVRVLYGTVDRTYDGAKLQVYIESTCNLRVRALMINQINGWSAWAEMTPVVEGTPTGWAEDTTTRYDDITNTATGFSGSFSGNGALLTGLNAANLASGTVPDARLSGTYTGVNITGNAATATALQTARTINGVSFNGTANITVADATKLPLTGGAITGSITYSNISTGGWARGFEGRIASTGALAAGLGILGSGDSISTAYLGLGASPWSSGNGVRVTSSGVTIEGAITGNGSGLTNIPATQLSGIVPDANLSGTYTGVSITGNAATATALATARTINGVSFNGTANITVADATKLPLAGGTLTGTLIGTRGIFTGTGNDYHLGGLEVVGNGFSNTVFPTIGFHQPGMYASSIQLRGGSDFRFYAQGGSSYASVTAAAFIGNGSQLTALNASNLDSGTVAVARGGTGVTTSTGSGSIVLSASPALTGTPTAPTAAVGTNTTQIATTAFVQTAVGSVGGFTQSLGVSGWTKMPNGVILQWGSFAINVTVATSTGVTVGSVTFPIAFPTAVSSFAFGWASSNPRISLSASAVSTTGLGSVLAADNGSGGNRTGTIYWSATGY